MAIISVLLWLTGSLIDIGGYRVHLNCTGEGTPTVMIVGAGFSFDWELVQNEVAKFTRVCTWDPSGTAWSDPPPTPSPTDAACAQRIDELHNLKLEAPLILVGLSVGAELALQYTAEYPDDVAGMVIVDHAFEPDIPAQQKGPDTQPALIYKTPIVFTVEDDPAFATLPQHIQQLHRWAASRNPAPPPECNPTGTLGDIPLIVISTANDSPGYATLQKNLLLLSKNSQQLVAAHSFHSIEISEPGIITEAIRLIHAQATRTRP